MKLALFGATRGVGKQILLQAIERGHTVKVLVRDLSKLDVSYANLEVVQGDVLNANQVATMLQGQDVALVALGGKPGQKEARPCAAGTKNILQGMKQHGVTRIVAVTSLGIGDSRGQAGIFFEKILVPLLLKAEFTDKELQEKYIRDSQLEYVIARPSGLTDKPAKGTYRASKTLKGSVTKTISRADVAHFCLEQLRKTEFLNAAVSLSD
jgi:putative NADH-flavin reductase